MRRPNINSTPSPRRARALQTSNTEGSTDPHPIRRSPCSGLSGCRCDKIGAIEVMKRVESGGKTLDLAKQELVEKEKRNLMIRQRKIIRIIGIRIIKEK